MSIVPFSDLRSAYVLGETVRVSDLPDRTHRVMVRTARGVVCDAVMLEGSAAFSDLPTGTHSLEAHTFDGDVLAEEFVSIRLFEGDDPVMGFVTSFDDASRPSVLTWLRQLRCTVVQVYDWMESYSTPLATTLSYQDPLNRPIERPALEQLIRGIRELGAVAQAYAPVIAADDELAKKHAEWRLFRTDGAPQSLGDLLQIMDPGNSDWQQHWIENYANAVDELGFNGFHLDTYGYPRSALTVGGELVSMEIGYGSFIRAVRNARPDDVLSFNQVNGVPRGLEPPSSPSFRYIEVWPPNDKWRHLESLLHRSSGGRPPMGDTLAIYPAVWGGERESALRTCVLSEAVTTTLGANALIWGDNFGVLCHPYYVDHEQLRDEELAQVLDWHRFALRCRDLFKGATDTSWYELDDENASVTVSSSASCRPEPLGGSLYVRVMRSDDLIVVSVLDLTGSEDGSWSTGTAPGSVDRAAASILVDSPDEWHADVAVLGDQEGRFRPLATAEASMREGRGVSCSIPMVGGWSVLRLMRRPSK